MTPAFRICKTRHLDGALTGEGARMNGGRWNSPGRPVVYTASSLSLATLEVMVHLEDSAAIARLFSWIALRIPDDLIEALDPELLPTDWNSLETNSGTRWIGDGWLRDRRSAALAVPSVVTPGEWNYLLNPAHHRFREIEIGETWPFRLDCRLL